MSTLACPKCKVSLPGEFFNSSGMTNCYTCDTPLQIHAFPALFRKLQEGSAGEALVDQGESTCFYHPQKRAAVVCSVCGRFLCGLCDMELSDQHMCPQCASSGAKKGKLKDLEHHRVLYDNLALLVAIAPLLIFYLTFITAPIAIFMSIKHWNAPLSILPRTKVRFVVAITVASLQLLGWALLLVFLFSKWQNL